MSYIRLAHANAHGWRKGGATYATSGTTYPPPIPSVAQRGEWSMGKVLNVYWHCAEPGDNYLGRVLAGLNALSPSFNILPPHFDVEDPMGNAHIHEAMQVMYGPILVRWHSESCNPSGVLLRVLASVVYHFDWIKQIASKNGTDHPFSCIPLMFNLELVVELKKLLTTKPSSVIKEATGIPPHVEQCLQLQGLLQIETQFLELLKNQVVDIKQVSEIYYILFKLLYYTEITYI